jgi:hypothetical protein
MDRDDARLAGEPRIAEHLAQPRELALADAAVRGEPRRRARRGHADQREVAADPHDRPARVVVDLVRCARGPFPARIAAVVLVEESREQADALGDVRVVIAGQHGDVVGAVRELVEPPARERELLFEREVRDVTGAQHVLDALRVEVLDHLVERRDVIVARPVRQQIGRADPALVRELHQARAVVRQEVQIGAVRESQAPGVR